MSCPAAPGVAAGTGWSVENLPQLPVKRQITAVDSTVGIALLVFAAVAIYWQEARSVFSTSDGPVALLNPELWTGWIPVFLVLLVLGIGVEVWKYLAGRWTLAVLMGNVLLDVATGVFVVLLVSTQQLVNSAFARAFEAETGASFNDVAYAVVVVVGTLVICLWDIIDSMLKYRRRV